MVLGANSGFPEPGLEMPLCFLYQERLCQTWLLMGTQGVQVLSQTALINSWYQSSDFLAPKLTNNSFLYNWQDWSPIDPTKREGRALSTKDMSVLHVQQKSLDQQPSPGDDGKTAGPVLAFLFLTLGLQISLHRWFAEHTLHVWSPVKGTWPSVLPYYKANLRKWLFQRVTDPWEPRNLASLTSCLTSGTIRPLGGFNSSCEWLG